MRELLSDSLEDVRVFLAKRKARTKG